MRKSCVLTASQRLGRRRGGLAVRSVDDTEHPGRLKKVLVRGWNGVQDPHKDSLEN